MPNFDLANLALAAVCPGNEILYDDKGMPSIMVKIPKMTYAQLGLGSSAATHPAFIINGSEVPAIWISKYQNIVKNGRAYSLPGQDPATGMDFDVARGYCEAKGAGWHLMTRVEWALLALWCKKNAFLPYGNNDYGKDSRETNYKAIPTYKDGDGNILRVATGTGPLTWSHDKSPSGIWDLNGNVAEWVGGMRTVFGELQVLVHNNAADASHSQLVGSSEWMAINGTTGAFITPNGSGTTPNSLKLDWVGSVWKWITGAVTYTTGTYQGCLFESVTVDGSVHADAVLLLQALGLYKHDTTSGAYEGDYLYADCTQAERLFFCGGSWNHVANAGVFYAYGSIPRSNSSAGLGLRCAFVNLPPA